jgi:hypothetical protein
MMCDDRARMNGRLEFDKNGFHFYEGGVLNLATTGGRKGSEVGEHCTSGKRNWRLYCAMRFCPAFSRE